jgi:hypothetical protein
VTVERDELVLTTASRALRRSVGPTAWVVLEALTADAVRDGDALIVMTSVRRLADALGLGRDAVAGAVQALAFAGRIRVESSRNRSGRFGASRYVVLPAGALRRAADDGGAATSATPRQRSHAARRQQLSLLDTPDALTVTAPRTPRP